MCTGSPSRNGWDLGTMVTVMLIKTGPPPFQTDVSNQYIPCDRHSQRAMEMMPDTIRVGNGRQATNLPLPNLVYGP